MGTDEKTFNTILTTRNWAHLNQVMIEYQTINGHSLEKAVESEFSLDVQKGLLAICNLLHFLSCPDITLTLVVFI